MVKRFITLTVFVLATASLVGCVGEASSPSDEPASEPTENMAKDAPDCNAADKDCARPSGGAVKPALMSIPEKKQSNPG